MKKFLATGLLFFLLTEVESQLNWVNVDSIFAPLPKSVHVFRTNSPIDGKPNIAYYVIADLNEKDLSFTVDTTYKRRLKPSEYLKKNNRAVVVVNTTFFSFASNQNLNVVIKEGKLVGYNIHSIPARGKDTLTYRHPYGSAIGISKKRKADIAWLYTDSSLTYAQAIQFVPKLTRDSVNRLPFDSARYYSMVQKKPTLAKWDMETAVGGGPVLVQSGRIAISNDEEWKFAGKAINDRHPRTAMGYTKDNKLVILVVEGRNPGIAEGASLTHLAGILKEIGCWEALNLDGGGSSCMLVNGKETIRPSDLGIQRAVPAVFIIERKE